MRTRSSFTRTEAVRLGSRVYDLLEGGRWRQSWENRSHQTAPGERARCTCSLSVHGFCRDVGICGLSVHGFCRDVGICGLSVHGFCRDVGICGLFSAAGCVTHCVAVRVNREFEQTACNPRNAIANVTFG